MTKRQKVVAENIIADDSEVGTKRVSIGRMKELNMEMKAKRLAERSEAAKRRVKSPGIDWDDIDRNGDPILSWDPNTKRHRLLLVILDRRVQDKTRKALVDKITTEFCRVYTRYRREAERRSRASSNYSVPTDERRYATEAGIQCLRKGVTPLQLLQYWDEHIRDFADRTMVLPPLSFLKAPANVDRVACSTIALPQRGQLARPGGRGYGEAPAASIKPKAGSSYARPDGLDPRLRPTLERNGFQTQAYNDRFMLTIEHNARLLAAGTKMFLPEGKPKRMAEFAAVALYEE